MADTTEEQSEEIVVESGRDSRYYNINKILSQNFLKSAKFSMRLYNTAAVNANFVDVKSEDLSFLCDAVEFPGQSLTSSEYRIPGKLKLKVPYLRELNEITVSFYHNDKIPLYAYFTNWIQNISPTNSTNEYFNNIVGSMSIVQFDEVAGVRGFIRDIFSSPIGGVNTNLRKYMTVDLENVYPLSFSSMPSNWADDGFHKMNVTFFYENINVEIGVKNLKFKDLMDSGNIVDIPVNSPARPPTNLDFTVNNNRTRFV